MTGGSADGVEIRVVLPAHLRTLARVDGEVTVTAAGDELTQRAVLDALESRFPVLGGTIRDRETGKRRAFVRFYACEQDLSNDAPDEPLPGPVAAALASGAEPFLVVGAMAGGCAATSSPSVAIGATVCQAVTMDLPVMPPVAPMLAKAVPAIPAGDYLFEPKWDGFRSIVFRDGDEVEIGSRNERPMTRYFPELVTAVQAELPPRCVIDGEIVLPDFAAGRLDFEALQLRLHPAASRVRLLAAQTPAHFVAFDLLALGSQDYTARPFAERRAALERALAGVRPPVHLTPATTDRAVAEQWFTQFEGAGLDGLIAKAPDGVYQPDKRIMFKIKHERTADCVVAGYRPHKSGDDAVGSLLLGLYRPSGELASIGVIGAFPMAVRRELRAELQPLVTTFDGHPWDWAAHAAGGEGTRNPRSSEYSRWNVGKDLSFVPLRPERVVEVRYDHMEGTRLRHTGQFVRWRPDRSPASCTFDQLEEPVSYSLAEILGKN